MKLKELVSKLQTLCEEGHSLDEVAIDMDGRNEDFADIEVRRVSFIGKRRENKISLVAWKKNK